MKNIPKKIFLSLPDEEDLPKNFDDLEHEFVYWSEIRTNKTDIEFVQSSVLKEIQNKVNPCSDIYKICEYYLKQSTTPTGGEGFKTCT